MKRVTLIAAILLSIGTAHAQQISAEIGRVYGGLSYKTSDGQELANVNSKGTSSFAIGYRLQLSDIIYPVFQINYQNYYTYSSDEKYGNAYSWDTDYIGISLGIDAEVWKKEAFHLLISGALNPQFLTKGVQTINGQTHDLRGVEQFEYPFLFARGGAGVNYCLENNIALSLRYQYGYGFSMGTDADGEELRLISHNISLGLLISIGRYGYCYKSNYK